MLMSYIKLNDILKKRGKTAVHISPASMNGARIKVLIGSCTHCAKLRDNVLEAAKKAGIPDSDIEVITDIAHIVRLGVITTPSLIVDGKLAICGKTLSVDEILPLIVPHE